MSLPPQDADAARPRWAGAAEAALLGAALLAVHLARPEVANDSDAVARFEALDALLRRGELSPAPYSLVGPLFSAPLWLLGRAARSPAWWCARYNLVLLALALAAFEWALRLALPRRPRRAFLLLVAFASMFPHHAQHYLGEVFTALLAGVGVAAVAVRGARWGWGCLVLAAVNTPAALPALGLVAAWRSWETRRGRYLLAPAAAAGLVLLESYLRRGHPLATGYEGNAGFATALPYSGRPGFSYPLFFGLLSVVLSFGKGLLFFAPGLWLPVPARAEAPAVRAARRLWLVFLVGLALVYARWWSWYGGWFWGPRFFLFASLPASLGLALRLADAPRQSLGGNLLTLAALALSFWVGLNGLVFGLAGLEHFGRGDYALEHLTWYVPEFSPLWRPFVAPPRAGPAELAGAAVGSALYLACFAYLGGPLVAVCARQAREALRRWRQAEQEQGPWRF